MNIIKHIQNMKGGIGILELEETMTHLIHYLLTIDHKISWREGMEWISDLIYLKKQDDSMLSQEICLKILNWIEKKYDHKLFEGFLEREYQEDQHEEDQREAIVNTLSLTLYTLSILQESIEVTSFLKEKIELTKNDFEQSELKSAFESIEEYKRGVSILNSETLDAVLKRTNEYFLNNLENGVYQQLFCGLRDTIVEHESSYSIHCCLASEEYLSPIKKTTFIGSGALFLSKESTLIEFSGSAPFTDWVDWFELKVKNQEAYWLLEIDYKAKKISSLKSLLQKTTPELLELLTKDKKIVFEHELWYLERIKEDMDQVQIDCRIIKKVRPIAKL